MLHCSIYQVKEDLSGYEDKDIAKLYHVETKRINELFLIKFFYNLTVLQAAKKVKNN